MSLHPWVGLKTFKIEKKKKMKEKLENRENSM